MWYVETSLNGMTCASGRLRPERNTFGFTPSVRMSTLRCASSRRAGSCCRRDGLGVARALAGERAPLLRHDLGVLARARPEHGAAAHPVRRADRALPRAAGALL